MKIHPEASEETVGHLKKLYEEVRAISHDLMPPVFRQVTLTKILEAHICNLNMRENCCFELYVSDEEALNGIGEELSLAVYRMVQELTGNIIKYSSASSAVVKLELMRQSVVLSVTDNGVGFDPRQATKGIGLQLVKNRIEELKGSFQLDTSIGNGCRITITFPTQL